MGDHLKHLETTLNLARDAGIQFKAVKSQLARAQILYVGYKASAKGWGPDPTKLKAVADFEIGPDSTINTVRQFIGMANQFSRFISDFSKKTAPLRALIKQDDDKEDKDELDGEPEGEKEPAEEPEDSEVRGTPAKPKNEKAAPMTAAERKKKQKERRAQEITLKLRERWTDECTSAVEFLKDQLTKAPIFAWPDFSDTAEPMELHVDASQKGLGAVVRQVQNGDLRVI